MVSQVQPQEEAEERVRKTKFLISKDSRNRRHDTGGATRENTRVVWRQKTGEGSTDAMVFTGVSLGKARQGRNTV